MLKRQPIWNSSDYQEFKCARPLDFSYRNLESLDELNRNEKTWPLSVRGTPKKGRQSKRYRTSSFWLNNNHFKHVNGLKNLTNILFEKTDYLSWLDLSSNRLTVISDEFLLFPNLSMLFLHQNNIQNLSEVYKLRKLKELKTLTLYNNPLCMGIKYRTIVIRMLPQIRKLDNVVVVSSERESKKLLDKDTWFHLKEACPEEFSRQFNNSGAMVNQKLF
ncbi:Leucine-rich repeat,Leucine-rich repeat domain, L domain-like [Cinara cedri]|uniref:Leucine-rich repeat-containing protein 51 n=1 Tax=Cinara cedri TaxID=506608 RepID=A0A5E4MQ41_9HEMI|nr:Leucine-rich repeat,Leucine-rich repeat domain, L domain-like [Cinara cedri]